MDQKGQVVGLIWVTNGDVVSWRETLQPAVGAEPMLKPFLNPESRANPWRRQRHLTVGFGGVFHGETAGRKVVEPIKSHPKQLE